MSITAQSGHVLNDIRTLFRKTDNLQKQIWTVSTQLNNLNESVHLSTAADSLLTRFDGLITQQQLAFEKAVVSLNARLQALEESKTTTATGNKKTWVNADMVPLLLAGGALLLSLTALVVVLVRRRAPKPPEPRQLELPLHPSADIKKAPETKPEQVLRAEPTEHAPKTKLPELSPDHPITSETLSKRSEIMELLGKKKPKSSKKVVVQHDVRKRALTDRANELIVLTSRGELGKDARAEAEREIAEILKEIMELH